MNTLARALMTVALLAVTQTASAQDPQQTPAPAQPQTTQPAPSDSAATTSAAAGKAVVIVYRPGKYVGKALEPSVFSDGVEVARMDNDRYFVLLLEPGEHRIHMTQDNKRVDVKLGAGEVAFIRIRIVMGMMKGRGEPSLTNEEDAAKDLKDMKPLGADKIKNTSLVLADKAETEALLKKYVK